MRNQIWIFKSETERVGDEIRCIPSYQDALAKEVEVFWTERKAVACKLLPRTSVSRK